MTTAIAERFSETWEHLSTTPLLWLTLTIGIYYGASVLFQKLNAMPLFHPLVLSVSSLVLLLLLTRTPYETYFEGAQVIHFLLGPATVALAIPLYLYVEKVKRMLLPLTVALLVGSLTGILSAVGIGAMLGASEKVLRSLAPKSITTPIAIGVSEQIGGIPSLTTVFVIITGMVGALVGKEVLDLLRIRNAGARGFAMGLAAHGLGTARALQMDVETGAFAGLAIGLNGAVTAVLVPLLAHLLWPGG
jgi:predicted murein hydrolase (TIGR00659 family)